MDSRLSLYNVTSPLILAPIQAQVYTHVQTWYVWAEIIYEETTLYINTLAHHWMSVVWSMQTCVEYILEPQP